MGSVVIMKLDRLALSIVTSSTVNPIGVSLKVKVTVAVSPTVKVVSSSAIATVGGVTSGAAGSN